MRRTAVYVYTIEMYSICRIRDPSKRFRYFYFSFRMCSSYFLRAPTERVDYSQAYLNFYSDVCPPNGTPNSIWQKCRNITYASMQILWQLINFDFSSPRSRSHRARRALIAHTSTAASPVVRTPLTLISWLGGMPRPRSHGIYEILNAIALRSTHSECAKRSFPEFRADRVIATLAVNY